MYISSPPNIFFISTTTNNNFVFEMDLKISFVIFTIIFLVFTGEASMFTSPKASPATSSSSSLLTACDMDYISDHMNVMSELTKEFLKKYIKSRNEEKYTRPQSEKKDKIEEKNKECLYKNYIYYGRALGIIELAMEYLRVKEYLIAIRVLKNYQSTIASTLVCPLNSSEFKDVKEWTQLSTENVIERLKSCGTHLSSEL